MLSSEISIPPAALNVMKQRVLFPKDDGTQETPLEAYIRVANHVARGHAVYAGDGASRHFADKVVQMLAEGRFMPNTPTLENAGLPNAQCSACFVLPVVDNLESIHLAQKHQGLIQASGGGTGFFLGHIRPTGAKAQSGRVTTRGPLNWLRMYNENATHVAQGRREGANMAILDISHPDIASFITCKQAGYRLIVEDLAQVLGISLEEAKRQKALLGIERFNISVSIPDKFMEVLERGGDWYFMDPYTKQRAGSMPAQELWDMIVKNAWESGEPGLFFVDQVNRGNSVPHAGRIETTNPCGEQPLLPYESCTLGHVNLSKYVRGMNGSSQVDWEGLEDAVRFGVQFLDNVVEVNKFPIPELSEMNKKTRRIGLGVMGWADMLAIMGIPYDSEEALKQVDEVGEFFNKISLDESQKLGCDRGNFPLFEGSTYDGVVKYARSNDRTTIAPTGQTSMYAGCSSGIEPLFAPVIVRNQAGMRQVDYHAALFAMLDKKGLNTEEVRTKLGQLGSVRAAEFLPEDLRRIFPSAHDIAYSWHVAHQTRWQKHITSAVSKTINFHHDAKPDDIASAYRQAWTDGAKGITVYRDGSRVGQPLSVLSEKKPELVQIRTRRSDVTQGTNRKIPNGCGNLMVYIGEGDNGRVEEITARLGKGGGCASAQTEAIARMASVALQHGVKPEKVISQLGGIRCHLTAFHKGHDGQTRHITSCGDAISVALSEHIAQNTGAEVEYHKPNSHVGACPNCGFQIAHEEGCVKCHNCGYSRC